MISLCDRLENQLSQSRASSISACVCLALALALVLATQIPGDACWFNSFLSNVLSPLFSYRDSPLSYCTCKRVLSCGARSLQPFSPSALQPQEATWLAHPILPHPEAGLRSKGLSLFAIPIAQDSDQGPLSLPVAALKAALRLIIHRCHLKILIACPLECLHCKIVSMS